MAAIPLVKAHQCYPFTHFMERTGMPVTRLLEQFRLPIKMLESADLYVNESRLWMLMEHIGAVEGLPDFGFRVGKTFRLERLGEFGAFLLRQPTLKCAIQVLSLVISSEAVVSRFGLERREETLWFFHNHIAGAPSCTPMMELYNLQCLLRIVQAAAGRNWLPPAIKLRAAALPDGLDREELTTGPILFAGPNTAIALPDELLALPMSGFRSGFSVSPDDQAIPQQWFSGTPDFAISLACLTRGYLAENPTLHDIADLVNMNERTLQRRLEACGTSFQELLDQARFDVARNQLADDNTPITEIALDLGYTDAANFSRAFKRWAGVSPRAYRNTLSR